MLLNLLVLYTFIIALFKKIGNFAKHHPLPGHEDVTSVSSTSMMDYSTPMMQTSLASTASTPTTIFGNEITELTTEIMKNCTEIFVNCTKSSNVNITTMISTSLFFASSVLPLLLSRMNESDINSTTVWATDETFDSNITDLTSSTTPLELMTENDSNYLNKVTTTLASDEDDHDGDYRRRRRRKRFEPDVRDSADDEYGDYGEYDTTTETNNLLSSSAFSTIVLDNTFENETFLTMTIESFLDNITASVTPDAEINTTMVSELWTEYLTTLSETSTDDDEEKCVKVECKDEFGNIIDVDETESTPMMRTMSTTAAPAQMKLPAPLPTITCPTTKTSTINIFQPTISSQNFTGHENRNNTMTLNETTAKKMCWETMFGQELVKLTVLDLVSTKMIESYSFDFYFSF